MVPDVCSTTYLDVKGADSLRLLLFAVETRDHGDQNRRDARLEHAEEKPKREEGPELGRTGVEGKEGCP